MTTKHTSDEIFKQIAIVLADLIEAVAPLIEATQPHLGQFGGEIPRPAPVETAKELRSSAAALRLLYPKDKDVRRRST